MIISIEFKNFRSVKENQSFSMEASASRLKTGNLVAADLESGEVELLKTAPVYGANASGKSVLFRLLYTMRHFVLNSTDLKVGDEIPDTTYDPFLLDNTSRLRPVEFSIDFVGFDRKRYQYTLAFTRDQVVYEYLGVYESSRKTRVFERKENNELVEFGDAMRNRKESREVPKNNLYLSRFGNSVNEQMTEIYLYFKSLEVWNTVANHHINELAKKIQLIFNQPEREVLRRRLSKLINIADTGIGRIEVEEKDPTAFSGIPEESRERIYNQYRFETLGVHPRFDEKMQTGEERLSFQNRQSQGTCAMFAIGGLMLEVFERKQPGVILLDEFNNSLHPDLTRFLIELFHNPLINTNGSQLVFATHDTNLLDNKLFRKDQIWFSEKNKYGETTFFNLCDFEEGDTVRSDSPFEKWYLAGKFSALPNIRKREFFAEYENSEEV